jgi:hypothetical protein
LVAAVVVAVAFVPMLVAYLQLGYPADAAADRADRDRLDDTRRYLDRAASHAARTTAGTDWGNRSVGVSRLNGTFRNATARLDRRGETHGASYTVAYNHTVAERVATERCPSGDRREFGPCVAVDGFVLQERAGNVTLLAVVVDLRITSPREHTRTTLVLRPYR